MGLFLYEHPLKSRSSQAGEFVVGHGLRNPKNTLELSCWRTVKPFIMRSMAGAISRKEIHEDQLPKEHTNPARVFGDILTHATFKQLRLLPINIPQVLEYK